MKNKLMTFLLITVLLLTTGCGNDKYIVDDNNEYVRYEKTGQILEKDIVTIWGIAQGDYSYTSVWGSIITLPFVNVNYLEINK